MKGRGRRRLRGEGSLAAGEAVALREIGEELGLGEG
jgi:hypothetical protein